jgi:hypothetical protein
MPVTVVRTYSVKTKEGPTIVLSDEEAQRMEANADISFVCDSPKCKARNATPENATYSWNESEIRTDLQKQYEVNKWIMLGPGKVVCSSQCAKDFFQYSYQPPENPKERIAAMEEEKKKQAEELAVLNPHLRANAQLVPEANLLSEPVQTRTTPETDIAMTAVEVPALCQADGHAEEP